MKLKCREFDKKLKKFHYWDLETAKPIDEFWSMVITQNMAVLLYTGKVDLECREMYDADLFALDDFKGIVAFESSKWTFNWARENRTVATPIFNCYAVKGRVTGTIHDMK